MSAASSKPSVNRREVVKRSGQLGALSSVFGGLLGSSNSALAAPALSLGAFPRILAQDEVRELEFYTFYTGADGPIMQSIVDRYNESQDGAQINFTAPAHGTDFLTRLQTSALADNPPQVVALHNYEIPPLAQYLEEVDPVELGLDPSNFVDLAFELPLFEGRLLGLTMSTGTMGLFYNKDHFEEAGLDPEAPPTTKDEFIAAAQALTRDGHYGFGHDADVWMPWLTFNWQAGGGLLSEDGTEALFNTPQAIEAAQLSQDLIHEYEAALPDISEDVDSLLYSGNVSMVLMGPWNLNAVLQSNEEAGTNIGWAKYPVFFDVEPAVHSTSHIYCQMKQDDPEVKRLGSEFIAWLLQEGSLEWSQAQAPTNLTVLDEMETSENPLIQGMAMWVEQAAKAKFPPYHPRWGEVSRVLTAAIQAITFQGAEVQSTLDEATSQSNDILARG